MVFISFRQTCKKKQLFLTIVMFKFRQICSNIRINFIASQVFCVVLGLFTQRTATSAHLLDPVLTRAQVAVLLRPACCARSANAVGIRRVKSYKVTSCQIHFRFRSQFLRLRSRPHPSQRCLLGDRTKTPFLISGKETREEVVSNQDTNQQFIAGQSASAKSTKCL